MPRWLLPVALLGLGLFFGWDAILPDGPGWLHRDTVQNAIRDSEGTMAEVREYLDKTASFSQAIEDADQDELKRLLAEQGSLNQRMKKRQEERQA
jgi:transcription initiation factor TFIIIB Brf1 subunit/transcription initiation factor TFIIB